MADKSLLELVAPIYGATSVAPILLGGSALALLKSFFRTEDDVKKDADRIRQAQLERLCISHDRLIPAISESFSDLLVSNPITQASKDDLMSILRGDGKAKPDLCYEHFQTLFSVANKLQRLARIRACYRIAHTMLFVGVVVPLCFGIIGAAVADSRGLVALVGIFCLLALIGDVLWMRRLGTLLERVEAD